jgi:hypothetical protein
MKYVAQNLAYLYNDSDQHSHLLDVPFEWSPAQSLDVMVPEKKKKENVPSSEAQIVIE